MIAETLISNMIVPLRTSDTGSYALELMNEFIVRHLPVVNDKELLGVLSEDDILNFDPEQAIGSYALSLPCPFIKSTDHYYEIIKMMANHNLTCVPVVNDEQEYIGLITMEDLVIKFANSLPFAEPGAIIVLEMSKRDYSLSELARIVESENSVVLSAFVGTHVDSTKIDVTLKINRQNVLAIMASFERFGYLIKASYSETEYFDILKDRYDSLINYLNV